MNTQRLLFLTPLLFLSFCIAAWSATELTGTSRDPQYAGGPPQKLMVVAAAQDDQMRRMFEDEFVRQFQEAGVQATPSYSLFTAEQLRDKAQRPQIEAKLKELGYDQVIVTRLIGKRTETMSATPTTGDWRDYYIDYYQADSPSQGQIDIANCESKLFALDPGKLIWSGNLETKISAPLTPESSKDLIQPFVKVVVKDLKKEGLV